MRSQLILYAIQQILGEARGADAAEEPEAWVRAERQIVELIAQAPTDEQLARLATHDSHQVDGPPPRRVELKAA